VRVGCQECSGRHMEHGMLAYGSATTRWDGYMGPFSFRSSFFLFW